MVTWIDFLHVCYCIRVSNSCGRMRDVRVLRESSAAQHESDHKLIKLQNFVTLSWVLILVHSVHARVDLIILIGLTSSQDVNDKCAEPRQCTPMKKTIIDISIICRIEYSHIQLGSHFHALFAARMNTQCKIET